MPKSFSLGSILAIVGGGLLVVLALAAVITGHHSFLSLEGLVIVLGGCVANAFLSYEREDVMKAFETIRTLLRSSPNPRLKLNKDIRQLIDWAYVVQSRDFIGLEKEVAKARPEPFLRYGIDLVISAYDAHKIREMMHTACEAEFERRTAPVTVLRNMAATAPAFGMVGTLIGMVMLLKNIGTDFSTLGGGLAIAMLSTLYGLLIARLVCLPAADKLQHKEEALRFRYYMLTEGIAMLAEKQNPFYMQDRLNSFLEPSRHFSLDKYKKQMPSRSFAMAS